MAVENWFGWLNMDIPYLSPPSPHYHFFPWLQQHFARNTPTVCACQCAPQQLLASSTDLPTHSAAPRLSTTGAFSSTAPQSSRTPAYVYLLRGRQRADKYRAFTLPAYRNVLLFVVTFISPVHCCRAARFATQRTLMLFCCDLSLRRTLRSRCCGYIYTAVVLDPRTCYYAGHILPLRACLPVFLRCPPDHHRPNRDTQVVTTAHRRRFHLTPAYLFALPLPAGHATLSHAAPPSTALPAFRGTFRGAVVG